MESSVGECPITRYRSYVGRGMSGMGKIGIISMQRVMNHGSFLQAYALKKTVENVIPNVKCEFIDLPSNSKCEVKYNSKSFLDILRFVYHKLKRDATICDEYSLKWNYYKFKNIYKECLEKHLGIQEELNHNTDYEAVIIGSDEVFNCTQEDAVWGKSMLLFGEDVVAKKIISYAASFGYTTEERLKQFELYEAVSRNLNNFSAISVRDSNSEQIISKMLGFTPKKHLDPVFIYDFYNELQMKKKKRKIFVIYQYQNRIIEQGIIEEIKRIAKEKGCKIVSVFEYCSWADENLVCTPFEAMEYIRDAEYVVTDTFHGCVMSIKFNKKFATFCRQSNYNKLMNLLRQFQLEKQLITENSNLVDTLEHEIDWEKINQIIEQERESAIMYLKDTLLEKKDEVSI